MGAICGVLAAGGWGAVVVIPAICLIAAILCSCYGIFSLRKMPEQIEIFVLDAKKLSFWEMEILDFYFLAAVVICF